MTGEVIVSIAYGIDVLDEEDPYIALAEKASKSFTDATIPGRFLVVGCSCLLRITGRTELSWMSQDSIPILKYVPEWVPGAGFKRIAREGLILSQAVLEVPFAEVKRRIVGPCQI
jgi:hypothetical protein